MKKVKLFEQFTADQNVNEAVAKNTKVYQIATPAPKAMLVEELEELFGDDYRHIVTEFDDNEGYESVLVFNLTKNDIKRIQEEIGDVLIWEYSIKKGKEISESVVTEKVQKIACLECDEVNTKKAWEKNNGFCPSCKDSSKGVAEANKGKVHKAAKQGSFPAVVVVVQDGKVIHQESVSTPEVAPATFNVMQKEYPKATIHLEDNTGQRLFTESVVTEGKIELALNKIEKWMPEDQDVQQEYYDIIDQGDVEGMEEFLDMYADEEVLKTYGIKYKDLGKLAKAAIKESVINEAVNIKKVTNLVADLGWEYDRMGSNGQKTYNQLCDLLGIKY